ALGDGPKLKLLTRRGGRAARVLAMLLRLEDAQNVGSKRIVESMANAILGEEPICAHALDALHDHAMPLGTSRRARITTFTATGDWIYEPLSRSSLPLPMKIGRASDDPNEEREFRAKLTGRLLEDEVLRDGTGEPSLVALGRLIEEE